MYSSRLITGKEYGLANGQEENVSIPREISLKFRVVKVSMGGFHGLALSDIGEGNHHHHRHHYHHNNNLIIQQNYLFSVYSWGSNKFGQLVHFSFKIFPSN